MWSEARRRRYVNLSKSSEDFLSTRLHADRFVIILFYYYYFEMSGDGWDRIQNPLNTRPV
jgi:hypothetical protein